MAVSRMESLLRKELRSSGFVGNGELFLIDTKTVEFAVLKSLLEHLFRGRVTITPLPQKTRKRKNVFIPTSLENELVRALGNFLEDKDNVPVHTPLMASIPEAMILDFAKRHGFVGETLAPSDDVRAFIEGLQEAQPQTKSSLRKSFVWLAQASKK